MLAGHSFPPTYRGDYQMADEAELPAPEPAPAVEAAEAPATPEVTEPAPEPEIVSGDAEVAIAATFSGDAARDPEAEAQATAINAELAATLIPMSHPDGGTCDLYKTDKKTGFLMVPASAAADMASLGFVVADSGAKGADA